MVHIKMSIYDYRDIIRICGGIADGKQREMLKYISLRFDCNGCTAYGCNGFAAAQVFAHTDANNIVDPINILMPPIKAPSGTKTVEFFITEGEVPVLVFSDADGDVLRSDKIEQPDGDMPDIGEFFDRCDKHIRSWNGGDGQYRIAVNPKYLISILEGMKSSSSVLFTFGSASQAFLVTPNGDDAPNASAMILPIRMV